MKLIRIRIENFGRLSGLDLELQDGVNSLLRENGWGKSTLAAFLRVMFYGLEGGRKHDLSENDRLKYKPWNKGHFGGSIEFEANGKRYIATRDFGEKEKDGSFRLQDAVTLLDSKDFSERLGEELFGIDRDSFERTSFIDHADLRYRGINSVIGSKVGSGDRTDDLGNYDHAQELMKDFLNANSPKKKTGELYKQEEEIRQLERDAGNQGLVDARIEGIKTQLNKEKARLEDLKAERAEAQRQQAFLAGERTKAINAKRKKELEEALTTRSEAVRRQMEGFGGRIPERSELSRLSEKAEEAQRCLANAKNAEQQGESERFERLKRYFKDGVPEENLLVKQIENCNDMQDGMRQREHLEEQAEEEKRRLESRELELQRMETANALAAAKRGQEKKLRKMLGVLVFAAGLLLGVMTAAFRLPGLLWIPAAVLILAGAFVLLIPLARRTIQEDVPRSAEDVMGDQIKAERENLEELRRKLAETEENVRGLEREIKAFLEGQGISYSRVDAENVLYEMKNRAGEYRDLLREEEGKRKLLQDCLAASEAANGALDAELTRMGLSFGVTEHAQIRQWVSETLQGLSILEKERQEEETARKAKEAFEEAHPELGETGAEVLSEEEIQGREEAISQRTQELTGEEAQIHEAISSYRRNLEDAYEDAENLREKKDKLEALKEQFEQNKKRYRLVVLTQEYLQDAKEQFTARFMQPIKSAFDRYYGLMTNGGNAAEEFQIDANVNVSRKEEGSYRDVETQSEGWADLIGLCIRMALLDVMYEKEKPVVIMDDPFASLDPDHLAGAKRFLEAASKEYQILYLTCHEVRL